MVKAEQIPNAVWIAMQSVIGDHVSVATQKEAIAAAINAWPGMLTGANAVGTKQGGGTGYATDAIALPMPQKETSA